MTEGEMLFILGLDRRDGKCELKRAYRFLSKRYHPDASRGPSSAERFVRIHQAYRQLELIVAKDSLLESFSGDSGGVESLDPSMPGFFEIGKKAVGKGPKAERMRAIRELGYSGRAAAWIFLRQCLYDADDEVKLSAVRSAAWLGIEQATGEIASLYARSCRRLKATLLRLAENAGGPSFKAMLAFAQAEGDGELSPRAASIAALEERRP
jgi:hypothetical protein